MKLCAGQCRYLITLYQLSRKRRVVRSVDIANTLSVTRPSVSRMLKCMVRLELINPDYSSSVQLTDKGKETAERLSRKLPQTFMHFFSIFLSLTKIRPMIRAYSFWRRFLNIPLKKWRRLREIQLKNVKWLRKNKLII